jgi:hypothetical protein
LCSYLPPPRFLPSNCLFDSCFGPERSEVLAYLKKSPDLPSDACLEDDVCLGGKKVFVYAAPSNTNQGRLWGQIAKQIPEECYVVLYTTKKIPSKIKKGYTDFMAFIDMRYDSKKWRLVRFTG